MLLSLQELEYRKSNFLRSMNSLFPLWDTALFINKVNQYYFTGTMQDALLLINKNGDLSYFVRRSSERARSESPLSNIYDINSYSDIIPILGSNLGNTYVEAGALTLSVLNRLQKYFVMDSLSSLENAIRATRAVKSDYELFWIRESAKKHRILLEERVPALLRSGMSEADLYGDISREMFKLGYQGITRFYQFQAEVSVGQIGFGTNTLYPSSFDGPGGSHGYSPAVPLAADHNRFLKKGDLVFVDIGFGINGYHSDKTQVYFFGSQPDPELLRAHSLCRRVADSAAQQLIPATLPSHIYSDIISALSPDELNNFMGINNDHRVRFLGHGVGLHIDEVPVIAPGFDSPLEENMVISLEPKKGVPGIGMAGVEETYLVTPTGGLCLTGGHNDIIVV